LVIKGLTSSTYQIVTFTIFYSYRVTGEHNLEAKNIQQTYLPSDPPSRHAFLDDYNKKIEQGELTHDPHQRKILFELQSIYNKVVSRYRGNDNTQQDIRLNSVSYLDKLFSWTFNKKPAKQSIPVPIKGLYIWGGVGRGKTYLVNYFYRELPIEKKLRLHFHRLMQLVHDELEQLDGISDPLKTVAENLANKTHVLCLDEIHVNDITDAMLLGRLFEHLFNAGVVLITTSNIHPDDLYKNGLQREQFLPAIHLLKHYTKVIEIEGELDYRLRVLEENGVYRITDQLSEPSSRLSLQRPSQNRLKTYFDKLSGVDLHKNRASIIINKRRIPVVKWADDVVWFSFDDICNTPRSASDYTQIGTFFSTVLISDIPIMDALQDDVARRFVVMVDEFYDLHVNLIVSAAGKPEDLYTGKRLAFEFERTASRLREMQSSEYIAIRDLSI